MYKFKSAQDMGIDVGAAVVASAHLSADVADMVADIVLMNDVFDDNRGVVLNSNMLNEAIANDETGLIDVTGDNKTEVAVEVVPAVTEQVVTPDTGEVFNQVTVPAVTAAIDANILAENIKLGVTILGVEGTYTGA